MVKFYTVLILTAFMLQGCSSAQSDGEEVVVAKAGGYKLYKSELDKYIPHNVTEEDSINIAARYINGWALNKLLVLEAYRNLPKQERDVSALVEEYKNQLLIYRLENRYLEQRLDTSVTLLEMEEFYTTQPDLFKTKDGLIKGWIVIMYNSSPFITKAKSLLLQSGQEEAEDPEEFLYNAAYKYHNFTDNWADIATVARDMDTDALSLLQQIRRSGNLVEISDSVFCRFLYVTDFIEKGKISPFEYNEAKIKTHILSNRKQELLLEFHANIINNALDSRELKITKNEDD